MKKLIMMLATAFAAAMPIIADTETVDGITWNYTVSGGKASLNMYCYIITGSTTSAIAIPSTLGGYPVTSIGYGAFLGYSHLTSVTIPNSVTSIGDCAFCNCSGLTSVTIPNSVTSIGYGAFSGCSGLTSVTIPNGVTTIGEDAFNGCRGLADANGFVIIRNVLYKYYGDGDAVTIPGSVTSIGDYAFGGSGLTSVTITIPDSVTSIGVGAFAWCSGLMSFTVAASNPSYKSVSGLLLTKDGTTLVAGVNGDVTIPTSVTTIGYGAFMHRSGLTSVTIPSSVMSIGDYAFADCSGLTSVTFKGSAPTSVGSSPFEYVKSGAIGTYTAAHAAEWEAVIDANGYWKGLKMREAKEVYTVTYIANNEKGETTNITVAAGTDYTIQSVSNLEFTWEATYFQEWAFQGWAVTANGEVVYKDEALITVDSDMTLYAVWGKKDSYTITYVANNGSGYVTNITVAAGEQYTIADIGSLEISWEGHYFQSWAFVEADRTTKNYRPGDPITPDGDMTLVGEWRMLTPFSADWKRGELTLLYGGMEPGMTVNVECRRGDNPAAAWELINRDVSVPSAEDEMLIEAVALTDTKFALRYEGISPVEYRVTDSKGGSATCMTRTKYALAVGVSRYENNRLEGNSYMTQYADEFANLARAGGAEIMPTLKNEDVTFDKINETFGKLAKKVQPGDVCLFYFGTHGGADATISYLSLYGKNDGINHNGVYTEQDLANHIDSLNPDFGVATVCIVHACKSGGFADNNEDEYCKGGWCVNELLTSRNSAWITATDSTSVSAYGEHFSKFLIGYGWRDGWAGTAGNVLTLGNLADYMEKTYDELFKGVHVGDNPADIKADIINKDLLDRISVGTCASHVAKSKPSAFSVTASKDDPDKVVLKTTEVSADVFAIFKKFLNGGKWSLGTSPGPAQVEMNCSLNADETVANEPLGTRHSSENDKLEFIVKAYNGAGVTASAKTEGWRATEVAPDPVTPDPVAQKPATQEPDTPAPVTPESVTQTPESVMPDHGTPEPSTPDSVLANDVAYGGAVENTAFAKAQTVVGALYKGDVLAGTVELKFGKINTKKGIVKVSGTATLMDGGKSKKVLAKVVNMSLAGGAMSGTLAFKAPVGSMAFTLSSDGKFTLKNSSYEMVAADVGGTLSSGRHTFTLGEITFASGGDLQEQLLPMDETFSVSGGKWTFGKNASVKWARDRSTKEYALLVDTAKGKTNLSSLKLTYTPKTGLFKGSFKVYALTVSNGRTKLAKYTANVIGFVVDGVGYGQATIKRPAAGPWSVTVK